MRTLLISFKDNDVAEAWIKRVKQLQDLDEEELATSGDLAGEIDMLGTLTAAHARVEALFARPTAYCKCPGSSTKGGQKGWYKSKVFGWFVCPKCKRPNRYIVTRWVASHCAGANNLLPALLKKLFPEPEVTNVEVQGRTEEADGDGTGSGSVPTVPSTTDG